MPSYPLSKLPLCSSEELIRAIEVLGAYATNPRSRRGSHRAYERELPDGTIVTTAVILNRREILKPTLKGILIALHIELDEFLAALDK